jgi:hypothetical protein
VDDVDTNNDGVNDGDANDDNDMIVLLLPLLLLFLLPTDSIG